MSGSPFSTLTHILRLYQKSVLSVPAAVLSLPLLEKLQRETIQILPEQNWECNKSICHEDWTDDLPFLKNKK